MSKRRFRRFWDFFVPAQNNESLPQRFHKLVRKKKTNLMKTINALFGSVKSLSSLEEDILDKEGALEPLEAFSFLDESYVKIVSEAESLKREYRSEVFTRISKEQQLYEITNSNFTYDSYDLQQEKQKAGKSVFQESEQEEFTISAPAVGEKNALPKDDKQYQETDIAQYTRYIEHHANVKGKEYLVKFQQGKKWSYIEPLKTFVVNPYKPLRDGNILSYLTKSKLVMFIVVLLLVEIVEIAVFMTVLYNVWGYDWWLLSLYIALPVAIGLSTFFGCIKRVENWLRSDIKEFKKVKLSSILATMGLVFALLFGMLNADYHRMEDDAADTNSITETTKPDFSKSQNTKPAVEDQAVEYYPFAKDLFYPLLSVFLAFSVGFISSVVLVFSRMIDTFNDLERSTQRILQIEKSHKYKQEALQGLVKNTNIIVELLGQYCYLDEIVTCPHTQSEITKILRKPARENNTIFYKQNGVSNGALYPQKQ